MFDTVALFGLSYESPALRMMAIKSKESPNGFKIFIMNLPLLPLKVKVRTIPFVRIAD